MFDQAFRGCVDTRRCAVTPAMILSNLSDVADVH